MRSRTNDHHHGRERERGSKHKKSGNQGKENVERILPAHGRRHTDTHTHTDTLPTHLEGHVLEEVGCSFCRIGLCPAAGIDPDADGGRLSERLGFSSDCEGGRKR